MPIAIFDPFSGISGDMTLGALLDVGLSADWLRALPTALGIPDIGVRIRDVRRGDIACTKVDFDIPPQPHGRGIREIRALVAAAPVPDAVRQAADRAFTLIAGCGGAATSDSTREWAARLREAAPDERAQAFVTELAVEPLRRDGEPDEKYADVLLARVGELAVSREITSVKARLQRMNPVEEQAGYNRMFGDLVGLEKRRKALLDRAAGG